MKNMAMIIFSAIVFLAVAELGENFRGAVSEFEIFNIQTLYFTM
jgi:hypothetical protein